MSSNTIAIIELLVLLNNDTCNVKHAVEATGLSPTTVVRYFKLLHKRCLIRIAEWKRYGNCWNWVPHYEWNPDERQDIAKPEFKTGAERQKRSREKRVVMGVRF